MNFPVVFPVVFPGSLTGPVQTPVQKYYFSEVGGIPASYPTPLPGLIFTDLMVSIQPESFDELFIQETEPRNLKPSTEP